MSLNRNMLVYEYKYFHHYKEFVYLCWTTKIVFQILFKKLLLCEKDKINEESKYNSKFKS